MPNTVNSYIETDLGNVSPNPRGEYNATYDYEYLDLIYYKGGSYVCLAPLGETIKNVSPIEGQTTTNWQCVAIPGDLTPEYISMYNEVVKDYNETNTNTADVSQMKDATYASMTAAQESESKANTSETNARNSEVNAKQSMDKAKEYSDEAIRVNNDTQSLVTGFDEHVATAISNAEASISESTDNAKGEIAAQKSSSLNEFRTDAETVMTNEKNVAVTEIHQMVDSFSADADSKKQEVIQVADEKINDMTALKNDAVNAKNAAETAATTAVEKASEAATSAGEAKSSSDSAKANADLVSANKIEIDNAKSDVDSKVAQFESDLETYSVRTLRSDMTELQKETSDGFAELKSDIVYLNECFNFANENLFVSSNSVANNQLSKYAVLNASDVYSISDYIELKENVKYTLFGNSQRLVFYNFNKTSVLLGGDYVGMTADEIVSSGFIDWFVKNNDGSYSFTVPNGYVSANNLSISMIRFTYVTENANNVWLVEGDTYNNTTTLNVKVPYLEKEIAEINNPNFIIEYWGDSLTQGNQDGTGVSRASVLQSLLGENYTIRNWGSGGEKSNTIACRQGGLSFVVKPNQTIPASGYVYLDIVDNEGRAVNMRSSLSGANVNPCYINGIKGTLSNGETWGESPYKFVRSESGNELVINRPTTLITNAQLKKDKNNVLIIEMGQNGGYDNDINVLIRQIKQMIDFANVSKYLVCGFVSSVEANFERNESLSNAFGRHFIDVMAYLSTPIYDDSKAIISSYGLGDAGLTATTQDITDITNGFVPSSLKYDSVHFNQYGYTVQANLEYQRGKELGYWS